jgi:hypothetical protein
MPCCVFLRLEKFPDNLAGARDESSQFSTRMFFSLRVYGKTSGNSFITQKIWQT